MDTVEQKETHAAAAADKHGAVQKPLRARPVKGKVDREALTKEIIRRFPKILDRLAK